MLTRACPHCFNLLFLILVMAAAAPGFAAFSNYNSILIGDQAAGMGGAYTAMTEDASALAWYNPATMAKLKGNSFSSAVGIYKKFDTIYNTDESLASASLRANQGFFRALPSSTGSVVRYDDFLTDYTVALSIVTPEYDSFKGEINNDGISSSSLSLLDESLWVGAGAARMIGENQSIGVTLYYTARSFSKTVTDRQYITPTLAKVYTEERALTQNSFVPVIGYHLDFADTFKFGLSVRLSSYHVYGKATYFDSMADPSGSQPPPNNISDVETKTRIPRKYTAGIAYVNPKVLILSMDLSYYEPMSYSDIEHPTLREYIVHRPLWNFAVGGEGWIRSWLKVRAGIFSNFSAHPNPDPQFVTGQGDRVDQMGWSANAALLKGNIQYTFGGYYTGGWGQSVQRIKHEYQVLTKAQQVFTMLVGTSYFY